MARRKRGTGKRGRVRKERGGGPSTGGVDCARPFDGLRTGSAQGERRLSGAEKALRREAGGRPRIVRNKRVRVQYAPTSRKLFQGEVREVFLEWFSATANVSLSARKAGIHYRTVLRHRTEDPAFGERFAAALETGMVRVRAWALELGEEAGTERVDVAVDMKPVNLTPDMALQLIREDERRKAAALKGTAHGPRPGRAPTVATSAEVNAALAKALRAYRERMRRLEGGGGPGSGAEEKGGPLRQAGAAGRSGQASTGSGPAVGEAGGGASSIGPALPSPPESGSPEGERREGEAGA